MYTPGRAGPDTAPGAGRALCSAGAATQHENEYSEERCIHIDRTCTCMYVDVLPKVPRQARPPRGRTRCHP